MRFQALERDVRDKIADKEPLDAPSEGVNAFGMTDAEWDAWQKQAKSAPLAEKAEGE